MNSDIILKAEEVGKQYRLGLVGTGTLSHDINRWWSKAIGKGDPYLKIGESNNRAEKGESDYVWAIKNISFEVKQGEVLGIIGKNGAGKSTLLKILSRVTGPTTGQIKTNGKIASLLEVGTGFHPEMTGRENIYLNGAILGMTKTEIRSKINEIVEFSGCLRYIDTPVKRYSSGMKVRLAFAVAAHLEPDILVVDEVLAVGDAEFQKKAIGKMQDISNSDGRTVLFVSHNMAAVKSLCTRTIVLTNGSIAFRGDTDEGVEFYLKNEASTSSAIYHNNQILEGSDIISISMKDKRTDVSGVFAFDDKISIHIKLKISDAKLINNPLLGVRVSDQLERNIFTNQKSIKEIGAKAGENEIEIDIPTELLVPNTYFVSIGFHIRNQEIIRSLKKVVSFKIEETGTEFHNYKAKDFGCVVVNCNWKTL